MDSSVGFPRGYVCPFMDELVDCLHTDELIRLIEKTCKEDIDKRTFMMFAMMYFFTYLNVSSEGTTDSNSGSKQLMKEFMSELILNSEKRRRCVALYLTFEQSVKRSLVSSDGLE